ncbi:EAL domain-containing protein [Coralloluteibacterium stylophorae]|uniref:EAL domain-containing protein n=2 Tax=Coralloluteibacterium stylophorae TaxID=1776034 RepID=A0A8J8AY84_9GAMM|nr:EAL domain-containing protein [Coralloluteibacterium stylophorae]MBS7455621.1 EAL domain-containing protein [Coralloluteibacterium stylophorae]
MAFQPIVDAEDGSVYAYEALVRGPAGEPAGEVLAAVADAQRYGFDQTCRVAAIRTATRLGIATRLSINLMPNAVYDPATCIRITLAAADRYGLPVSRIVFELTEQERIRDLDHTLAILRDYQRRGFTMAIDDFGAGFSGLGLLAECQPQLLKLDMGLVRGIDGDPVRRAIVEGVLVTARGIGSRVVAEGVETEGELVTLHDLGVRLFQGYWFGRPALEALPEIDAAALAPLRRGRTASAA